MLWVVHTQWGLWTVHCVEATRTSRRHGDTKLKPPIPRTTRAGAGNWGFEFGAFFWVVY